MIDNEIYILKGGDNMFKKLTIATGVFAVSAMAAATMTFAQTAAPTTSNTTTVSPTNSVAMPSSAPATGKAE